jgi:hypothetical protein
MAEESGREGTEEEKTEPPPGGPAAAPVVDSSKQVSDLIQNFGMLIAPNSNFGTGTSGSGEAGSRAWLLRSSGRFTPAEIEAALRYFVRPACYNKARAALHQDHVVVLAGGAGTGKRTAAVALLSERVDTTLLLPPVSLRILSERIYDQGTGYLLEGSPDQVRTVESAVTWRMVRDRVRDAKAYLVVTSTAAESDAERAAVCHVRWTQPPAAEILRAYLPGRDDDVRQIAAEADATGQTMTELADLARRVADGEPLDEALRESDRIRSARVSSWFQEHGARRPEVLAMTALAFLSGAQERSFETYLALLEELIAGALPVPEASEPAVESYALPRRGQDRLDGTLVSRERIHGLAASRTIAFRHPGYQRHVLAELSDRYPVQFWDAVRDWLGRIVREGHGPYIAAGLAHLARVDFGEVRDLYLEPWSEGAEGWLGQLTATYTLWMMCYDELTLPLALPTANRWAGNGSSAQRWAAAVALSGELGTRYPAEAIRRLWELVKQSATVGGNACLAFAGLFASLVDTGKNASAGQLLTTMDWQRRDLLAKANPDLHLRERTTSAIIEVLGIREVSGSHPAILRLLRAQPEQATTVGGLWAYALRNRAPYQGTSGSFRTAALVALQQALLALRTMSAGKGLDAATAEQDARTIGEAIARALPQGEIQPLIRDLTRHEARSKEKRDETFTSVLLTVLDRHVTRPLAEEVNPQSGSEP